MTHEDIVLSTLCRNFINRHLFKVEISTEPISQEKLDQFTKQYAAHFNISPHEAQYFMGDELVGTDTYSPEDDNINILFKDGTVKDIVDASDMLNITVLTKKVEKHFFCYYKI